MIRILAFLILISMFLGNLRLYSQEMVALDSINFPPSGSASQASEEGETNTGVNDNILDFDESSIEEFNQFGSFGLFNNGIKIALKTDH